MNTYIRNHFRAAWARVLSRFRSGPANAIDTLEEEVDWLGIG